MILKAELNIPPELVSAIADAVMVRLMPMLSGLQMSPHQSDDLMGVAELAKYLGDVSKDWIYQRTANNEIPFVKIGHLIKFRRSDIDRWLSAQVVPAVNSLSRRLPVLGSMEKKTPSQDIQSHGGERKKCL